MSGFTKDEIILNKLGRRAFFPLWFYSNLYRDTGAAKRGGDGQELCDSTLIYGNTIVFFSDKRIKFNKEKEEKIAWARWAKKAIYKPMLQIEGARKWVEKCPDKIFTDKKCKEKIPIIVPKEQIKFHNIIICHGIEDELNKLDGSLIFNSTIKMNDIWNKDSCTPFQIGCIEKGGCFYHVFTGEMLNFIRFIFDTVKDFLQYLYQRECLLRYKINMTIVNEADIVSLYYKNNKNFILEAKELTCNGNILIHEYNQLSLINHPQIRKKIDHDSISYFWDRLIITFLESADNKDKIIEGAKDFQDIEPVIRKLVQTSRFERRCLANVFIDFYNGVPINGIGTRQIQNKNNPSLIYLFFAYPYENMEWENFKQYKSFRVKFLEQYCYAAKYKHEYINEVIGIGFKSRACERDIANDDFLSELNDYAYIEITNLEQKDAKIAYDNLVKYGYINPQQWSEVNTNEFPA